MCLVAIILSVGTAVAGLIYFQLKVACRRPERSDRSDRSDGSDGSDNSDGHSGHSGLDEAATGQQILSQLPPPPPPPPQPATEQQAALIDLVKTVQDDADLCRQLDEAADKAVSAMVNELLAEAEAEASLARPEPVPVEFAEAVALAVQLRNQELAKCDQQQVLGEAQSGEAKHQPDLMQFSEPAEPELMASIGDVIEAETECQLLHTEWQFELDQPSCWIPKPAPQRPARRRKSRPKAGDQATSLHQAAKRGNQLALIRRLQADPSAGCRAIVDSQDQLGRSALLVAIKHKQLECARALAERGASWFSPVAAHLAPRNQLLKQAKPAWLELLLEYHNLNSRDPQTGQTMLEYSLEQGLEFAAKFLLTRGAKYRTWNPVDGRSPLLCAVGCAKQTRCNSVSLLLGYVCKRDGRLALRRYVNAANRDTGRTALHEACERANCCATRALVYFGAQSWRRDRSGRRPIDLVKAIDSGSLRRQLKACLFAPVSNNYQHQPAEPNARPYRSTKLCSKIDNSHGAVLAQSK